MRKEKTITNQQKAFKKSKRLSAPKNADWYIDDFYMKMGLKGFIFTYIGGEWIKSTKTIKDVFNALKSPDKRCFSLGAKQKGEVS